MGVGVEMGLGTIESLSGRQHTSATLAMASTLLSPLSEGDRGLLSCLVMVTSHILRRVEGVF